jgi:hypothetical protein
MSQILQIIKERGLFLERAAKTWPEETSQHAALSRSANEMQLLADKIEAMPRPSVCFSPYTWNPTA